MLYDGSNTGTGAECTNMTVLSTTKPNPGDEANASDISTPLTQIESWANGGVDDTNIASVSGSKIADGTITPAKLASDAVETAKLDDGAVTTAKIANDAVTDDKLDYPRFWHEIGRTTLGTAGDTITVNSLPARKYLKVLVFAIATGGTIGTSAFVFNNDTGSNYSRRVADNGAGDTSTTSQSSLYALTATAANNVYAEFDIINVSNQEKLVIGHAIGSGTAGAGNATARNDSGGKWANTSAQISRIDLTNGGTGDFAIGSEMVVLGHD